MTPFSNRTTGQQLLSYKSDDSMNRTIQVVGNLEAMEAMTKIGLILNQIIIPLYIPNKTACEK